MILYLDTSSLVKLYVEEEHADAVRDWVERAEVVATSAVALPEAVAALSRRRREGDLTERAFGTAHRALLHDWPAYATIAVDAEGSASLATEYPLRGLDAIHLAAALSLHGLRVEDGAADSEPADVVRLAFASFDVRQIEAARAEGLDVLWPARA